MAQGMENYPLPRIGNFDGHLFAKLIHEKFAGILETHFVHCA